MSGLYVFFSYSHKDEELRKKLEVHLTLLKRQGKIRAWSFRQILAGQEWENKIDENLAAADVILLLVSPDFLASDYCWDVEMKRALERHEAGTARVIPIILRSVDWSQAPFAKLQALPRDARAVMSWPNLDEAFHNVAQGLRAAIEDEQSRRASPSAPAHVDERAVASERNVTVSGDVVGGQIVTGDRNVFAGRDVHVHVGSTPQAAGASSTASPGDGEDALALWREKLAHYLREEAITSDAGQKFTLKKQIEEARTKIRELGG